MPVPSVGLTSVAHIPFFTGSAGVMRAPVVQVSRDISAYVSGVCLLPTIIIWLWSGVPQRSATAGPRNFPISLMPSLVTYPPRSSSVMTSSSSIAGLLILGIVFHLVYIGTVFDCYFASPVVHGMRQYKLPQAQAKRLVLIVGARTQLWRETTLCLSKDYSRRSSHLSGDGLRADFAFTANASQIVPGVPERVAPYLRDIVENRGAYGVSHTHVPTESRPGHVAIIGALFLVYSWCQCVLTRSGC